jgi:tetratricopeptide (TPR) repeat protein
LSSSPKPEGPPRPAREAADDVWVDEGPVREAAETAVARGAEPDVGRGAEPATRAVSSGRRVAQHAPLMRSALPSDPRAQVAALVGAARAPQVVARLESAVRAFEHERYQEAEGLLGPLARELPGMPTVRELRGLSLYRLERWRAAATELEAYRDLTGAVDRLPVLADCYRAQRRYRKVDEVWTELREASPSAALVAEGRIVAAGALADQGDLQAAIALLERSTKAPKRVGPHHLRQWYALADLYDRAGDTPRAGALFRRIAAEQPGFGDVAIRLASLGR